MGKIVEKKKKKKGRPSLLDIQKRTLREQQQNQRQTNHNPNSNPNFTNSIDSTPNSDPSSRFNRHNTIIDGITEVSARISSAEEDEFDEAYQGEKKFKFVLRLPPHNQNSRSLENSPFEGVNLLKKRKISGVEGGSADEHGEKEENNSFASKQSDTHTGTPMESDLTTPLPDKKLLVFILDRLQKKDTYGVFSEPVDPKELPDYHEIVENPMDFGTVRKKLSGGAYSNLEEFEKDVFLICSNAMKYNAPDTIYFRQARSIQELARKDFENLRQESDDNESQPKVARRGRPPTKNLKKRLGRPPIDRTGSEVSSNATLANVGDNNIGLNSYDLRRGPLPGKSGPADTSGRIYHGSRSNDALAWSADHYSESNNVFPASNLKGVSMKLGMKHFVLDETRRNTYMQSELLGSGRSPSVLGTFDGEKKQLMAVGLHTEHGFARSLARFAASLGPIAWKIASKKIERALPAGVKFGPGWVGESESPSLQSSLIFRASAPLPQQPIFHKDDLSERLECSISSASDMHLNRTKASVAVAPLVGNISCEPTMEPEETTRLRFESGVSSLNGSNAGIRSDPPTNIQQGPFLHPPINGFNSALPNCATHIDKLERPVLPEGATSTASVSENHLVELEDTNVSCSSRINSDTSSVDPSGEPQEIAGEGLQQSSWQESSDNQILDSVPPDLNIRFQSPLSPAATQQPDLLLQL